MSTSRFSVAKCSLLLLGAVLPACGGDEPACRICPDVTGIYQAESSANGNECGFDFPLAETLTVSQNGVELTFPWYLDFEASVTDDLTVIGNASGRFCAETWPETCWTIELLGRFSGEEGARTLYGELRFSRTGPSPCETTANVHWTPVEGT